MDKVPTEIADIIDDGLFAVTEGLRVSLPLFDVVEKPRDVLYIARQFMALSDALLGIETFLLHFGHEHLGEVDGEEM